MERKKRILILTVTAGNGHNACAKAMQAELEAAGAEVRTVDFLKEWSDDLTVWTVDKGYNIAAAYFLYVYNASFRRLKQRPPEKRYMLGLAQKISLSGAEGLLREVYSYRPDVIYCTHLYPAIAITDMRLLTAIPAKVYITTFDYTLSPFWESCIGVDYLNLPSEDFAEESRRLGYRDEQFLCCGIPVASKFLAPMDKAKARTQLGMRAMFTVMVMFGGGQWSGGQKIFKSVVRALEGVPAQIVMINGRNEREKRAIDREIAAGEYKDRPIVNVGFTDKVDVYMAASDVIVTKLGGTGASECIDRLLPIVAAQRLLPQQEAENADYLTQRGAALTYRTEKELRAHLLHLMSDPEFYEGVRAAQAKLRKDGVTALAAHILSQPYADYEHIALPERENFKRELSRLLKEADKAIRGKD